MILTPSAEQQVFQSAKRLCYAGLDSVTLRTELARRVERVIPTDASNFCTTDPETGLLTHGITTNLAEPFLCEFLGSLYPDDEAIGCIDQHRAGQVVKLGGSERLLGAMRENGLEHDMRALFSTSEALWGSWCFLRAPGEPAFIDREVRFVERLAPHVGAGLKAAAVLELAARGGDGPSLVEEGPEAGPAPGFLVLGRGGEIVLRTPSVCPYLDDLAGEGAAADGRLPFAVNSVRGRLLRMRGIPDDAPADARLRARGRSGAWYSLRATLSEPDPSGISSTVVSIEPVARQEVGPLLFRLYGLSPREREVIVWVVRGESTKRIAGQLGLSVHTVQDYLDKACDKVGVRGRKALVAKLFRDGFLPSLAA
jgi:DNA-binding CsgD family transcriptional regulator